jgi:hypothetical protein
MAKRPVRRSSAARSRAPKSPPGRRSARRPAKTSGHPVVHWEIAARNPQALHRFYQTLFGWSVDANNPMGYSVVTAGKGGINGGIGPAQGTPHVTF